MTGLPKDYHERKALPLYDFLTQYFPDAIFELVKVAVVGNEQHNPGESLHWARGKSMDQLNTAMRHIFDHGAGRTFDDDPGVTPTGPDKFRPSTRTRHLAKAAWRLLAQIQLDCEAEGFPTTPLPCRHPKGGCLVCYTPRPSDFDYRVRCTQCQKELDAFTSRAKAEEFITSLPE